MTRTKKTKAADNASEAVQEPEPPDAYLKRNMANMEALTFDTLRRAAAENIGLQLSVGTVAVAITSTGDVLHGDADGHPEMTALGFAVQAGLLMGAARAQLASDGDDSSIGW